MAPLEPRMHHQTLDPFDADAPPRSLTILACSSAANPFPSKSDKGEVPAPMGSPMVEGRVDPHKKAHFTLHISDAIAEGEVGDYTSVKYNHKPAQTTSKRRTRLTQLHSREAYQLTLEDDKEGDNKDVFIFRGQQTVPKKSYVLLFDPTAQKATLEPLSTTYTFNINSKNGLDISSAQPKIYPRKQRDDVPDEPVADDLFGEDAGTGDGDPDAANPFDFRHFLSAEKGNHNRGDESEYAAASSPDYRTGTGSALNTPQFPANRKSAATTTAKSRPTPQAAPKPTRRKIQEPAQKVSAAKIKQTPTVRLERRATSPKLPRRPAVPPSSKIKSAEIVHSSDESDADEEGEVGNASSPPAQRSPLPAPRHPSPDSNEDGDGDGGGGGGGDDDGDANDEIEDVDLPPMQRRNGALSSLNHGQSIGMGYSNSPGEGPISLSAASSIQGSPNPHIFTSSKARRVQDDGVIDFGDLGGGVARSDDDDDDDAENEGYMEEEEDRDVDSYHLGSPAQPAHLPANGGGISLGTNAGVEVDDADEEEEEEDPLLKEMMEGLAGGSESEESEEE